MMVHFTHKGINYCSLTGSEDMFTYLVIVRSKYFREFIYEGEQLGRVSL